MVRIRKRAFVFHWKKYYSIQQLQYLNYAIANLIVIFFSIIFFSRCIGIDKNFQCIRTGLSTYECVNTTDDKMNQDKE